MYVTKRENIKPQTDIQTLLTREKVDHKKESFFSAWIHMKGRVIRRGVK